MGCLRPHQVLHSQARLARVLRRAVRPVQARRVVQALGVRQVVVRRRRARRARRARLRVVQHKGDILWRQHFYHFKRWS